MGSAVHRRTLLAWLAASFGGAASAQAAFPSRPLRIVVPNAAGGAADITARTVGQKIAGPLGQSVVIDNKPSAGGVVAGEQVARAEPDGHTLLLVSSGTAVSAALFQSLPFDTLKDFAPVSLLATFDLAVVVKEGGRFRTLGDLLTYARAHPGQDRHSPDMTLLDQTPDILPVKNILDRQRHRFRSSDHIVNSITDVLKAHREGGAPNGPDLSVQKARQTLSPLIHHPKSRHMAARIDPQNSHFREPYRVEWRYEPVWRSVCTRSVPPTGSASP